MASHIHIGELKVRVDDKTGYLCITDPAKVRGNYNDNIKGWMKDSQTIKFFEEWEKINAVDRRPSVLKNFTCRISTRLST